MPKKIDPAASMRSFIKQVNEWGDSGYPTTSPTQIYKQWMVDWNPEMLAAGRALSEIPRSRKSTSG